jgi:hypothetical protein
MQYRFHIDTQSGLNWYRCKQVELAGDTLRWELNPAARYDLTAAYERAPHRQLILAADDKALQVFMRAWGPLTIALPAWTGEDSLAHVRSERDKLAAWVRLFVSIEESDDPRAAAIALLRIDPESCAIPIRSRLGLAADPKARFDAELEARLTAASKAEVADVCEILAGAFPASRGETLTVDRTQKHLHLRATVSFLGLWGALYWMVWQDLFRKRPFSFCVECGRLIQSQTQHERRFCTGSKSNCARKWTDREWKRKTRAEGKRQRLAGLKLVRNKKGG